MRHSLLLICLAATGSAASAPSASAATDVTGKSRVFGYACPSESNGLEHPVNRAKREAVEAAESQCDWTDGRPTVRRTNEWTVDTSCETLSSGFRYGSVVAEATFSCD